MLLCALLCISATESNELSIGFAQSSRATAPATTSITSATTNPPTCPPSFYCFQGQCINDGTNLFCTYVYNSFPEYSGSVLCVVALPMCMHYPSVGACICVCVYLSVCAFVCISECMCICVYIWVYVHLCVCFNAHTNIFPGVYAY